MAADGLIDQYLTALGKRVRSRSDRHDLLDEVRDHLLSAVERLEALGVDSPTAERRALTRFGQPKLVAALVTEVPSKGNLMSLFLARHLPAMSVAAAVTWLVAVAVYGQTDLLATWTPEAYIVSSAVIAVACVLTASVLVGLNVRATGEFDTTTILIALIGIMSAVAALLLSWFIALWLPLLAIAVIWTMVRAWTMHAGSRPFAVVMLVTMPLLAAAAIVMTVIGQATRLDNAVASWIVFAGLAAVLAATLVDVAVRLGRRATHARVSVAG